MAVWHDDPDLQGRFHPQYPDDLQVLVHEGSFRFTDSPPEIMWARIFARLEWTNFDGKEGYAYKAQILNQPRSLKTLKLGDEILFSAHKGYAYAVRVTHQYIMQLDYCEITPCNKCGLPDLFDAPADLIAKTFPDLAAQARENILAFNSFCPLCGVQGSLFVKVLNVPRVQGRFN